MTAKTTATPIRNMLRFSGASPSQRKKLSTASMNPPTIIVAFMSSSSAAPMPSDTIQRHSYVSRQYSSDRKLPTNTAEPLHTKLSRKLRSCPDRLRSSP